MALLLLRDVSSFSPVSLNPAFKRATTVVVGAVDRRVFIGSMAGGIASSSFSLLPVQPANALGGGLSKINDRLTQ